MIPCAGFLQNKIWTRLVYHFTARSTCLDWSLQLNHLNRMALMTICELVTNTNIIRGSTCVSSWLHSNMWHQNWVLSQSHCENYPVSQGIIPIFTVQSLKWQASSTLIALFLQVEYKTV